MSATSSEYIISMICNPVSRSLPFSANWYAPQVLVDMASLSLLAFGSNEKVHVLSLLDYSYVQDLTVEKHALGKDSKINKVLALAYREGTLVVGYSGMVRVHSYSEGLFVF